MGRMWICEGRLADRPLQIKTSVSLYSFEELCYYLYHNAESVEESFYNEEFCRWIAEELDLPQLAEELREGIEKGKSGGYCLEQILTAGGLYSHKQISGVVSIVQSMESTGPAQRAKLRGDRFLKSGRYRKAWMEYQKALAEGEDDLLFQSRVWHNMGTMYARQFLFEAAGECYTRAHDIGQQTKSSEAHLLALTFRDEQTKKQGGGSMDKPLRRLREMKASGDRIGFEGMIEDLLQQLRVEYRKSE